MRVTAQAPTAPRPVGDQNEVRTVQAVAKAGIGAGNDRAEAQAAAHEKIVAEPRDALAWHWRPWWRRLLGS